MIKILESIGQETRKGGYQGSIDYKCRERKFRSTVDKKNPRVKKTWTRLLGVYGFRNQNLQIKKPNSGIIGGFVTQECKGRKDWNVSKV